MIKIVVHSAEVVERSGNAKATGKPYHMGTQKAWVHMFDRDGQPQPYPQPIELKLDRNEHGHFTPYPVGEYTLDPSSLYVDRMGGLRVSPRLKAARTPSTPRPTATA